MQFLCSIWKILHLTEYFYTGTVHGARNKYQVCLGHVWSIIWGMSGATSGACLGHHLGHVWGNIWGMSGASSGACLGHHLGHRLGHHLGYVWA